MYSIGPTKYEKTEDHWVTKGTNCYLRNRFENGICYHHILGLYVGISDGPFSCQRLSFI